MRRKVTVLHLECVSIAKAHPPWILKEHIFIWKPALVGVLGREVKLFLTQNKLFRKLSLELPLLIFFLPDIILGLGYSGNIFQSRPLLS